MGNYRDRLQSTQVRFGGVNTRDSVTDLPPNASPYARNVVAFPAGSVKSRKGFSGLIKADGETIDTPGAVDEDNPILGLAGLQRASDSEDFLVCSRGGAIWQRRMTGGGEWFDTMMPVAAGGELNAAMGRFLDAADVYHEAVAFCCTGVDEPFIVTGLEPGSYWSDAAKAIAQLTGAAMGAAIAIKITAHGLATGDVVSFSGLVAADWTALNGNGYRIEKIDADNFYLLDNALARVKATGGAWSTIVSPTGTAKIGLLGILRWPKGKYSTSADRQYGYPARWDDPDDDGSLPWGTTEPASWPRALSIFGQGLEMRAYAYGFQDDPSRVDVSMLGEPSNFLKVDVDAADEAAATTSPEDGGYFYVTRGDGDIVTGAAQVYGYLVFTKKSKLTLWTGGFGLAEGGLQMVATLPVGNANPKSMGVVGSELFFWDPVHGPKRLAAVQEYGDLAPGDLGDMIPDEIAAITPQTDDKIRFVHDRADRCVKWFVCSGGSTTCNRALVYYYALNEWQVWDGAYCECVDAVASEVASEIGWRQYGARHDGSVVYLDQGYEDGPGMAIASEYRTKWFAMPDILYGARPLFIDVIYGELGNGDSEVKIAYDFSNDLEISSELDFARGEHAVGYDYGLYDDGLYDASSQMLLRHNLEGDGSLFQLIVRSDTTTPWQIVSASIEIAVRGKRQ